MKRSARLLEPSRPSVAIKTLLYRQGRDVTRHRGRVIESRTSVGEDASRRCAAISARPAGDPWRDRARSMHRHRCLGCRRRYSDIIRLGGRPPSTLEGRSGELMLNFRTPFAGGRKLSRLAAAIRGCRRPADAGQHDWPNAASHCRGCPFFSPGPSAPRGAGRRRRPRPWRLRAAVLAAGVADRHGDRTTLSHGAS